MSKFSNKSPRGAVQYLNQFPKNFLRPYGVQEDPPDEETVYRRIKPESCEWLLRPKVAASEMADTILQNMQKLEKFSGGMLLRPSSFSRFKTAFQGVEDHLSLFNTKESGTPSSQSVKSLLKFLCDDELDKSIDEAFQIGSMLFSIGTQVIVARSLIRNTEKYAEKFCPVTPTDEEKQFKREKSLKSLKEMPNSYYSTTTTPTTSKEKSGSRKRLFAQIDSEEDKASENDSSGEEMETNETQEKRHHTSSEGEKLKKKNTEIIPAPEEENKSRRKKSRKSNKSEK